MGNEKITIKQISYLLCDAGFKKCEIWKESDYVRVHNKTKEYRSHLIATEKMNILEKEGLSEKAAQAFVILEGKQKVNKKNLSLLGTPVWKGTIETLTNQERFYDEPVRNCYIKGIFRNRIDIII